MARFDGDNGNNTINGNNNQNDEIYGYDGDDTLNGRGGADLLVGGRGNDTYIIDQLDTLVELAGEGIDEVRANFSYTLLENFENLRLTGNLNINATGNGANNELWGNSGNNILDGAGGSDIMRGGAGNDIYITDGGDTLFEGANNGIDEVRSSATWTLNNNFENLTLTGSSNVNGTGNNLNNVIAGNGGDNVLNGGNGVDTLQMTRATSGPNYLVSANLTTGTMTGHGNDTILNFENVIGTALGDWITGSAGNNIIDGAGGHDELFVTNGIDTLIGGDGADAIRFDGAGAATANLATGVYSIDANNYGTFSSITHVIGSAFNDTLTGNNDANHMGGGAGDDYMIGGLGNDQIWGGAGNDRLVADFGNDTLSGNYNYVDNGSDGPGADVFEVRTTAGNVTINDFEVGIDKLDLSAFGFNSQGVSAYWTANAVQGVASTDLTLTGQQGEVVTICLSGVTRSQGFSVNDMIGGSASLVPPPPQYPMNGGNGVADVFLIDPNDIMTNHNGVLDIYGFEDGLDVLDLRPLDLTNYTWDGWVYDYGPNDQARLEFWGPNNGFIAINLVGQSYFNMDMSDYII